MEAKKNNKFFIGTVISLFVLVFCIGGAVADIDTALEGAKKIGEKAQQIEQTKKAFSTAEMVSPETPRYAHKVELVFDSEGQLIDVNPVDEGTKKEQLGNCVPIESLTGHRILTSHSFFYVTGSPGEMYVEMYGGGYKKITWPQ
jgi:hypothetical protein